MTVHRNDHTTGVTTGRSVGEGTDRTRRRFLRTIGTGASIAVLGGMGLAAARDVDGDVCLGDSGELGAGDAIVLNNDWSTRDCPENVEMCISTYEDGTFGWEWERGITCVNGEDLPNYPQALMGTKIGGTSSGWGGLPKQTGEIDRLDVEIEVDMDLSDGEWNFALEWWMDTASGIANPTDEIMTVLHHSPEHTKGGNVVTEAFEDKYGNVFDYWENDIAGGDDADWNFHIFRIQGDSVPKNVDFRSLIDYLIEDPDGEVEAGGGTYDGSKYISGIEIGNENWDETDGETIVEQFSVRVNDTVGTAGVRDSYTDHEESETTTTDEPETTTTDEPEGPDWPEDPTDPDDDGLYEDLSGNEKVDFPDVNLLFQNADSAEVEDNVEYYDFDDDGSVDLQDVLALFDLV
ncbi:MAG: hypothetical protein ACOCYZ_04945 [Halococcoides sp.]